ncbi:MAG TPA: hypothetical protein VEU77_11145 [Candidatus Acidoferrales bacterium]|nr:hypothetical protein [Candidatus Acidoferrales bacterium]
MGERTKTTPTRTSRHSRTHRTHRDRRNRETADVAPQIAGGGGSSGRGPFDDDDGGHKPERPNDGRTKLLIALGILAVGAGVMTARVLAKSPRRRLM